MRSQRLNQQCTSTGAEAADIEARLIRSLEAQPAVNIPADFATRVARQLPPKSLPSLPSTHYGRNMVFISMAILAVALLGLALRNADHSTLGLVTEWILCAQFLGIIVWLGTRPQSLR